MKTLLLTAFLFCLQINVEASSLPIDPSENITKMTALKYESTVYFNFSIKNESEEGWYVLIKECELGGESVLGMKKGHCNQLNTPLVYSFKDDNIHCCKAVYKLMKIKDNTQETIATWEYSKDMYSIKRAELKLLSNPEEIEIVVPE